MGGEEEQAQEAGSLLKPRIALCLNDLNHINVLKTLRKSGSSGDHCSGLSSKCGFKEVFPPCLDENWNGKIVKFKDMTAAVTGIQDIGPCVSFDCVPAMTGTQL